MPTKFRTASIAAVVVTATITYDPADINEANLKLVGACDLELGI